MKWKSYHFCAIADDVNKQQYTTLTEVGGGTKVAGRVGIIRDEKERFAK